MTEYVSVEEVGMTEVRTDAELKDALGQIYRAGLPGFVIRATTDESYRPLLVPRIAHTMSGVAGKHYTVGMHVADLDKIIGAGAEIETGILHTDISTVDTSDIVLNVHRTRRGSGKVILANSGPQYREKPETADTFATNLALLTGRVDPDIVSPTLYTTELAAGDVTVFGFTTAEGGPTWHRFDTTTPRKTESTFVLPMFEN